MLLAPRGAVADFDRHFRRAVWITALITDGRRGLGLRRQGGRGPQLPSSAGGTRCSSSGKA